VYVQLSFQFYLHVTSQVAYFLQRLCQMI
jgi:hypothetical protein